MRKFITLNTLAIVLLGACSKEQPKPRDEKVPVTVATAQQQDVPLELQAIGSVQPFSSVDVKSQVSGQLTRVSFKEGDDVRKGQLLFSIDPRPFQAELAQAQAALQRDLAQLRNAESEQARYASLVKQDFVTKQEADRTSAAADVARANVAADRAAVENARLQLAYCEIRSPLDARTGNLMVHAGNVVKANDIPLVKMLQITPIYVQFALPESALNDLRSHANLADIKVTAFARGSSAPLAEGTLSFIDNAVDPATGMITLKATFANAQRTLWPGQFVTASIRTGVRSAATVVPTGAVQAGQKGQFVYVVKADDSVELRPVSVFRTVGQNSVLEKGVSPGEVVVTDGQLRLTPKSKVDIKQQ